MDPVIDVGNDQIEWLMVASFDQEVQQGE